MKKEIFKKLLSNLYLLFKIDETGFPTAEEFLKYYPEIYYCFKERKVNNDFSKCDECDKNRRKCCSFLFFTIGLTELNKLLVSSFYDKEMLKSIEKEIGYIQ